LAAFGGRSAAVAISFSIACLLFALVVRGGPGRQRGLHALDYMVSAIALLPILQAVPVPRAIVEVVSPHSSTIRTRLTLGPGATSSWLPLSIDQEATIWASLVIVGAFALFFAARRVFAQGGMRPTVRGISAVGLGLSAVALAQAATAGRLIYWRFPTDYEGPLPFGPFVNRNHFATWVIMAAPLCLGYIAARAHKHDAPEVTNRRTRLARLADGRTLWLTAAAGIMISALLATLSRSGILSLAVAVVMSAGLWWHRAAGVRWWAAVGIVVAVGLGVARADLPALAERVTGSGSSIQGRVRIWTDTLPVVRDFWLTGTGAGTYRTAMLYYQRSDRVVQFNQAHNHYLQAAAEGGGLLLGLVTCALFALARAVSRLGSPEIHRIPWIHAGATTGLMAVALQSIWETGLVMPANAALAAVLAAVAVHERLPDEKSIFRG
jgi:putative inorganic carbon (HCO3(-)) transporter